jgi:uncharacterized lipoprotein YbaY
MFRSCIPKIALVGAAVALLAAMARARPGPEKPQLARVTGMLTFWENLEFLPGTIVSVEIRQVATSPIRASKPLGEVVIRDPKRVPIPFTVLYDTANLNLDREYVLHARVYVRRRAEYTSGPGVPVITLKNPTRNVLLPMILVRSGTTVSR